MRGRSRIFWPIEAMHVVKRKPADCGGGHFEEYELKPGPGIQVPVCEKCAATSPTLKFYMYKIRTLLPWRVSVVPSSLNLSAVERNDGILRKPVVELHVEA